MPTITVTVPDAAVPAVSTAFGGLTGTPLATAVKAALVAYLKEYVRGYHEREAREAAALTVTAPNIT